jgi:hypothetical protein
MCLTSAAHLRAHASINLKEMMLILKLESLIVAKETKSSSIEKTFG